MLSPGRIVFAICFVIIFVLLLVFGYRRDIRERASNYKGSTKILIIILSLLGLFILIINALKFIS
ncbi:MAG: hypothetical protein CMP61_04200 [Flavobacteriales bacterium]|nr:hypothetical protein [Flavobacteriales bacterium]